uniref:FCP1 homology domain-containing protein n=1 Tax=Zooxanthella nutricula TaxID=1333877 RepID=A0A6V0E682_9DINO|mmetsp:Transcript_16159/g.47948  ORF Transcript_16159/g.47948 Transcript_16159/m.47948 type:complete len:310 (+) Transcript_16159:138-1067(+)
MASASSVAPDSMEQLKKRTDKAAADREKVVKERLERVKQGMEQEQKKRRAEEKAKAVEVAMAAKRAKKAETVDLEDLYGGLPPPDPKKDQSMAQKLKEKENWRKHRFPVLPQEDPAKVIFLDVDGVLRPLTAGGFRAMMVDGEWALRAETADFISSSLLSLRHIVENTGAIIVLSSEWRRDQPMREGVDNILMEYEMRPCATWTPTDLQRDMGTENPFKAFTERRAREISQWLSQNPQVKQWVVIDDINMADADEGRKPGTLLMAPRIVQTHRKIGLTLEQAKAAVKLLRGEKLPPQILSVQPSMELTG